jgi:hypothetical protein
LLVRAGARFFLRLRGSIRKRQRLVAVLALCAVTLLVSTSSTHAQEINLHYEPPAPPKTDWARTLGLGTAGAVSAFVLHETGHVVANLLMGNVPKFSGTRVFGFIPFVVIRPRITCEGDHCTKNNGETFGPGRNGVFFIATAGFHVQNVTDEVLLTLHPDLMARDAPFQKGMLAFNVFWSTMYAVGAYTGLEDPHGDLAGAARRSGMHEAWLATVVLAPAVLDTYRYFAPSSRWAPWVSRASKAALFGLTFVF